MRWIISHDTALQQGKPTQASPFGMVLRRRGKHCRTFFPIPEKYSYSFCRRIRKIESREDRRRVPADSGQV
jgi:hypothetical protein